ncbi:MAG: DUF1449 family protein [Pirellulaceae bacterium]
MFEFLLEIIHPVNLPATLLLGLILLYWFMVIFGAIGVEAFDFDFDIGGDVDGDFDVDATGHGPLVTILEFFHLGDVPVTVFASVFALCFWVITVMTNHYVNSELNWLITGYLFVPCLVTSLLLTKLLIFPAVPFFRSLESPIEEKNQLVGRLALVATSELSDEFGQVEIHQDGPSIILNARCHGAKLTKGDVVELIDYDSNKNTYLVRLSK